MRNSNLNENKKRKAEKKKMRVVELTLSNYVKAKHQEMVEKECVEVLKKLTDLTLSKLRRGEKEFSFSFTMSPLVYNKIICENIGILNFEHLNADKIDFKNPKPQCFRLKHNCRIF